MRSRRSIIVSSTIQHEPPWYGTVCPVVWEDGGSNPASYPIKCHRPLSFTLQLWANINESACPSPHLNLWQMDCLHHWTAVDATLSNDEPLHGQRSGGETVLGELWV